MNFQIPSNYDLNGVKLRPSEAGDDDIHIDVAAKQEIKIERSLLSRMRKWSPIRSQTHARLANSLTAFYQELDTLGAHAEPSTESNRQWVVSTRNLLKDTAHALNDNDPERGWQCFCAAQRTSLRGLETNDLKAKARIVRAEANSKLKGWRKEVVLDLLTKDGKLVPEPDTFSVVLARQVLDEHSSNEYHKLRGIQRQTRLLCLIALAAVFVSLLLPVTASVQIDQPSFLYSVILYGVLGAAISGVFSLTNNANEKRIPELLQHFSTTMARVSVGAATAFVIFTFLRAGLLQGVATPNARWLILALSFVAGFSERLLVRAIETVNPSG